MKWDKYKFLSPFELKDNLKKIAKESSERKKNEGRNCPVLNAGRGNPNFLNIPARKAFSMLNLFVTNLASSDITDMGFRLNEKGIAKKFYRFLSENEKEESTFFLKKAVDFALEKFLFDPDSFIFSLADAALGSYYPTPPRILPFTEKILTHFANDVLNLQNLPSPHEFDIFATEGCSGAMVYLFNSLKINKLIKPKDSIAFITPIFSPYLEMPHLKEYDLTEVFLESKEDQKWQVSDEELKKLEDLKVKVLCIVNPANPSSYALDEQVIKKIAKFINTKRPDLIVISDTVYATFVDDFHSIVKEIPENTICVYSFSKYFGVTGWRLGFIMLNKENILDKKIALQDQDERYKIVAEEATNISFIERLELDSRNVSLAHTGGLGGPQQAMMTLLALFELMDEKKYRKNIHGLLKKRNQIFFENLNFPSHDEKGNAHYYVLLDILKVANHKYGKAFVAYLEKEVDHLDFLFKMAEDKCTILLPGSGFGAPKWSFRVSLANLDEESCALVGKNISDVLQGFFDSYDAKHY